jgi:hypothetical protein
MWKSVDARGASVSAIPGGKPVTLFEIDLQGGEALYTTVSNGGAMAYRWESLVKASMTPSVP